MTKGDFLLAERRSNMIESALVILSGGQDSTTCLFWARQKFSLIYAITFDYEQRHAIEIEAAKKVASIFLPEGHEIIKLGRILKGCSPLISDNSVEQYQSLESMPGGIEKTFVPARNSLFLTLAMNRAVILDCKNIVIGLSQVDYGGYPDCREDYLTEISLALNKGVFGQDKKEYINIWAPLLNLSKKQTVELAMQLGADCIKALAYSHTCYNGVCPPCGKCHSCLLRQQGFEEAGIRDPLIARLERRR